MPVQELARIKPRSARVMAGSWRMARLIIFGKLESVGNDNHDTDMIFVTSSTSSASVKKDLAQVKLSRGNAQSVFPQGVTV